MSRHSRNNYLLHEILAQIGAGILLFVGTAYKLKLDAYTDMIDAMFPSVSYLPIIFVVLGSIMFIVSFLGCCGAITRNMCKLLTYATLLLIMFILQLTLIAFAIIMSNYSNSNDEKDFKQMLYLRALELLMQYNQTQFIRQIVDVIQNDFECCGIGTSCDWILLINGTSLPMSCCAKPNKKTCSQTTCYAVGCLVPLYEFIQYNEHHLTLFLAIMMSIEICAGVVAVCLANSIRVQYLINVYAEEVPPEGESDLELDDIRRGQRIRGTAVW